MDDYESRYTGAEIDGRLAGIAPEFDEETNFNVGDCAFRNRLLYRKIQNPGSGPFRASDWIHVTVGKSFIFRDENDDGNITIEFPYV